MPTVPFTDLWIRAVEAHGERAEFSDATCSGLRLRVGARGKVFYVNRRTPAGTFVKKRLGDYPTMSLREARRAVTEFVTGAERLANFGELVDFKLAELQRKGSREAPNYGTYLRTSENSAEAFFGRDRPASEITPEDVTAWLRKLHAAGVKTQHPRAYLSAAFGAALKADFDPANDHPRRFGITANPVAAVGGASAGEPRDRVLSIDELRRVWAEFRGASLAHVTSAVLRGVIATGGLRVTEISELRRDGLRTIDGEPWLFLPKTKNGRAHAIPLPARAIELFDEMGRATGKTEHVFAPRRDRDRPLTHNSISQAVRRWAADREIEPFQPRDLRRTMKTLLIGFDESLREPMKVWQNHGVVVDVADRHYDWCLYPETKRRVRDRLNEFLTQLDRERAPR